MDTSTLLTGGPSRSSITVMRGLLRLAVVGFTVVSLLLVAAVGVAASSGKGGSSDQVRHSVVSLFSGHLDLTGFHEGTGSAENGNDKNGGNSGDECRPHKHHHRHATGDHENNECGGDDSGSD